jgi:hypothetical protein
MNLSAATSRTQVTSIVPQPESAYNSVVIFINCRERKKKKKKKEEEEEEKC